MFQLEELRQASPLIRTQPSESSLQALAGAKCIKPVRKAQIYMDGLRVPIPVHLAARRAVHEQFAAVWTVPKHEGSLVGGRIHRGGGGRIPPPIWDPLLGKTPSRGDRKWPLSSVEMIERR